jgi:hypothetical protein
MQCDKKTFLADVNASKKRNLMLVGGHADNPVEVCGEGNADAKSPRLGKGQTMQEEDHPVLEVFVRPRSL